MLYLSATLFLLQILVHKSFAVDLQELCKGQRYGTLVPNPKDCNSFYVCQFVVQLTHCDIGLHFDRKHKVCNWPQFAGCDWVDAEGGSSMEFFPVEKPLKPTPAPEESKPSEGGNVSDGGIHKPGVDEGTKPSGKDDVNPPSDGKTSEEIDSGEQYSNESEELDIGNITEDDFITDKPAVNGNHHGAPSTVNDYLIDEPKTPNPISEEDHNGRHPSTDDDVLTEGDSGPTHSPIVNSAESVEVIPDLPHPNQPNQPPTNNSEESVEEPSKGNEDSSEKIPPTEGDIVGDPKPPLIEGNVDHPDHPPTAGNHTSEQWNLIATIISVESSQTDGFINRPIVGPHSPETGYPVDVMFGYDPANVQCLHNGLYFLPHPSSCQKYFICAYRHLHLHSCGDDVIWNHKREQCDLKGYARCYAREVEQGPEQKPETQPELKIEPQPKPQPEPETEPEPEQKPDPEPTTDLATPFVEEEDIETSTTETTKVTQTSTRKPHSRPPRLPATTISHRLPICPMTRQVYLPNLDDCHRYYICIMGKPVLTSCPSGMHWDAIGEFCGKPTVVRCAYR